MTVRLKEGRYRGRVIGQALTESGGTPCAEFQFWVTQMLGPAGLAPVPNGGARRTVRLWLTEAGLNGTKRALQQLGSVPEKLGQLDPYALDAVFYTGHEVDLECVHREYEGQLREDWNVARPQPPKLSDTRIAELDAQFAHLLKTAPVESLVPVAPGAETVDD